MNESPFSNEQNRYAAARGDNDVSDDEISLVDLAIVLWRRRWVLVLVTVLCVVAGVGYALIRPSVYSYTSSFEVGQVYNNSDGGGLAIQPVESANIVKRRLENILLPQVRDKFRQKNNGQLTAPKVSLVLEDKGANAGPLLLKSEVPECRQEDVQWLHRALVAELKSVHAERVKKNNQDVAQAISNLKSNIEAYKQQKKRLQKKILPTELLSSQTGTEGSVSQDFRGDLDGVSLSNMLDSEISLIDYVKAIESRQNKLNILQTKRKRIKNTHIEDLAVQSSKSVKPNKKLIVALSGVLGLMLAVFAAFGLEFVGQVRRQLKRQVQEN